MTRATRWALAVGSVAAAAGALVVVVEVLASVADLTNHES